MGGVAPLDAYLSMHLFHVFPLAILQCLFIYLVQN